MRVRWVINNRWKRGIWEYPFELHEYGRRLKELKWLCTSFRALSEVSGIPHWHEGEKNLETNGSNSKIQTKGSTYVLIYFRLSLFYSSKPKSDWIVPLQVNRIHPFPFRAAAPFKWAALRDISTWCASLLQLRPTYSRFTKDSVWVENDWAVRAWGFHTIAILCTTSSQYTSAVVVRERKVRCMGPEMWERLLFLILKFTWCETACESIQVGGLGQN
jgi:hypothetical protein